jgi:hypothetical protein
MTFILRQQHASFGKNAKQVKNQRVKKSDKMCNAPVFAGVSILVHLKNRINQLT